MWLLLNRFSLGHLLLGTAIALVAGQGDGGAGAEPAAHAPAGPDAARCSAASCVDIVRSNVAVARLILAAAGAGARPGFVEIDLELRDPTALAIARGHRHQHARHGLGRLRRRRAAGCCMHVLDLVDEDGVARHRQRPLRAPAEGDLRMSATILHRRRHLRPGGAGARDAACAPAA